MSLLKRLSSQLVVQRINIISSNKNIKQGLHFGRCVGFHGCGLTELWPIARIKLGDSSRAQQFVQERRESIEHTEG